MIKIFQICFARFQYYILIQFHCKLLVVKVQYFNGSLRREKIMQNIFGKVNELSMTNKSFVLCTIVEIKGSSPGKTGFRMIVFLIRRP
jgi:hypothetical protein